MNQIKRDNLLTYPSKDENGKPCFKVSARRVTMSLDDFERELHGLMVDLDLPYAIVTETYSQTDEALAFSTYNSYWKQFETWKGKAIVIVRSSRKTVATIRIFG